jgi:protein O-mannosyl-transferase
MSTSEPALSAKRISRLVPVVIVLVVVAAFWPTLSADFVHWDDDANFLNNPHFRGLSWQNLRWMLTTLHMSNYQPVSWMVAALGFSLWGMQPFGYHATSLALHALNAVMFYFVSARLLRLAVPAAGDVSVRMASAFAALFFALHPLRVEPVAWLSGQHDLLAAAFCLLAVLGYLRAYSDGAGRRRWLLACTISFAAAMLSKVNGIMLPWALLLLDVYPLRRLPADPRQWRRPQHRRVWLEKLPLLGVAVVAAALGLIARHATAVLPPLSVGFRIQQACYGLAFYLGKTMVPVRLLPFYTFPSNLALSGTTVVASAGLVAVLSGLLWSLRRTWPGALVAWICYVVTLLPVLGLISFSTQLAADRYTYLPCLAWALLAGAATIAALARLGRHGRQLLLAGLAAALLMLAGASWRQSRLWRESETLFRYTLSVEPGVAEVHNDLGFVLVSQRRTEEGMAEYRKALALKPDFTRALNNLGLALIGQGRHAEAVEQYRKALALEPDYAFGHNNLGLALMYLDQTAEAMVHFQKAVDLVPDYVVAHNNLGGALLSLGRIDRAIVHFRKALELRPDYAAAATMLRIAEEQRPH